MTDDGVVRGAPGWWPNGWSPGQDLSRSVREALRTRSDFSSR